MWQRDKWVTQLVMVCWLSTVYPWYQWQWKAAPFWSTELMMHLFTSCTSLRLLFLPFSPLHFQLLPWCIHDTVISDHLSKDFQAAQGELFSPLPVNFMVHDNSTLFFRAMELLVSLSATAGLSVLFSGSVSNSFLVTLVTACCSSPTAKSGWQGTQYWHLCLHLKFPRGGELRQSLEKLLEDLLFVLGLRYSLRRWELKKNASVEHFSVWQNLEAAFCLPV